MISLSADFSSHCIPHQRSHVHNTRQCNKHTTQLTNNTFEAQWCYIESTFVAVPTAQWDLHLPVFAMCKAVLTGALDSLINPAEILFVKRGFGSHDVVAKGTKYLVYIGRGSGKIERNCKGGGSVRDDDRGSGK